jgi:hypothetical protein
MQHQRERAIGYPWEPRESTLVEDHIKSTRDILPVAMMLRRGSARVATQALTADSISQEQLNEFLKNPWETVLQALEEADYEAASAERSRAEYCKDPGQVAFVRQEIAALMRKVRELK